MSKTKLTELRDEFVRNYHINCEHEHRELTTEEMNFMFHAWDAAIKAQAEVSSADVEFDGGRQWYLNFGTSLGVSAQTPEQFNQTTFPRCPDFKAEAVRVIEYSAYEQNRAALSTMKSELDEWRKCARRNISLVEEGNILLSNQFTEIEKLRAEKANDWKRMDEAKDSFACTVDQLNAAVDQQAIEINKLRETLSAMNSLATKYRNNCDMLMQYRGVFKDEIEKLRAENAILREGLEAANTFLRDIMQLQIKNLLLDKSDPSSIAKAYEFAKDVAASGYRIGGEALTAADKVRSE